MFFARSDWLLKLGIVPAINPRHFAKKGTVWCWLFTGLAYTKKIIHLSVG